MADVVNIVQWLSVTRGVQVFNPRTDGLVFSRHCICRLEVATRVEALEDRGVETCVAVLDDAVLVFYPHKHVVRVEEVLALLALVGVVTKAQRVVARRVGLTVNGLENVLGVVLEHLLGFFGQLVRVVLELLVQSCVCCSTVLGEGRCIYGVAISSWVLGNRVTLRAGCREAPVWVTTSFKPHLTGKSIRHLKLGTWRTNWTFRVLNELVALGCHPAFLVVRRNFTQERSHQLHVAVSCDEGAHRAFDNTVKRTGGPTVGLTEHLNTVAAVIGERFNPDAVLLISTRRPRVLAALMVGPGDALIARTESEGALAAVTADHVRKGVGLCAEDWRVGAVLVAELGVDGNAVQLHVAVIVRSTRVAIRAGQIHVAGDQPKTDAVSIGKVGGLGDTTAGNHISIDDLVRWIRRRSRVGCGLRIRNRSRNRVDERSYKSDGKRGGCNRRAAATSRTVKTLHIHEESFLENN